MLFRDLSNSKINSNNEGIKNALIQINVRIVKNTA